MRLPGLRWLGRLRADAVPEDWDRYLAALEPVVASPSRLVRLPDDELLLAAVHVARLQEAAQRQDVARSLPGVPFRDWDTAWDAGQLADLPALAHLEGRSRGASALAAVVADPYALAGLARQGGPLLWQVLEVTEAQESVLRVARARLRTRPPVDEVLAGAPLGVRWGAPAGWDERRSQWDRLQLRLFVQPAVGEDDFDDQLARLPQPLARTAGEPFDGTAEQWLAELEEAWFELVLDLDLELQSAGGLREPWTGRPWEGVSLLLQVRPGPPVSRLEGERELLVEVPYAPATALPLEDALDQLMRTTAGALLSEVPDLTGPARALLREQSA